MTTFGSSPFGLRLSCKYFFMQLCFLSLKMLLVSIDYDSILTFGPLFIPFTTSSACLKKLRLVGLSCCTKILFKYDCWAFRNTWIYELSVVQEYIHANSINDFNMLNGIVGCLHHIQTGCNQKANTGAGQNIKGAGWVIVVYIWGLRVLGLGQSLIGVESKRMVVG